MTATRLIPGRYALISADDPPEFFARKRDAIRALNRYRREAERVYYREQRAWGHYLPWAAVARLSEVGAWEMTEAEFQAHTK